MHAFYASSFGGPEVMTFGELPDPRPRAHDVLVSVEAASINPVDWKVRLGDHKFLSGFAFPKTLGGDYAGIVTEVGAKVRHVRAGDCVYGFRSVLFGAPGAHAELVLTKGARVRQIPQGVSFVQAAALPVAALTALAALRVAGNVAGKRVRVNGATGGVGHFALQIAKARGAHVTAVCSEKNRARAIELGADEVIDYRAERGTRTADGKDSLPHYDVIYDAFGGSSYRAAKCQLSPGGVFVTTLPSATMVMHALIAPFFGHRVWASNARDRPEDYQALEDLITSGAVRPVVDHVFPLSRAPTGFALAEAGGFVGKIVLRPTEKESARD